MLRSLNVTWMVATMIAACGDNADRPTKLIGTGGGTVTTDGLRLIIPAGALSDDQTISIMSTDESAPVGYVAASPIYRLAPGGLVFREPVEAQIELVEPPERVSMYWSRRGEPGFEDVGGTVSGTTITASNTHFSTLFAAQGPPLLAASPLTLDFGSVVASGPGGVASVTVTNIGKAATGTVMTSVGGDQAARFDIVGTTCTTVEPDATCSVTVRFAPMVPGAAYAELILTASPGDPVIVGLLGSGLAGQGISM